MFISVSFQPVFATNTFQDEKSDLIKIVINSCNVNGGRNNTKYLTQEQYKQLKGLFEIVNKKLDNSKDQVETIKIFKDAVESINYLGLLPKDMTVEEAQKLVTGGYQNPKTIKLLESWFDKRKASLDDNENVLCFVTANTTETFFCGPVWSLLINLIPRLLVIIGFLTGFLYPLNVLHFVFWNVFPLNLGYEIGIGKISAWYEPTYYPANGQIHTSGKNGQKSWHEFFWGNLSIAPIEYEGDYIPGVLGFTGLDFVLGEHTHFFIGFALKVKIDYEQPIID